MAKTSGASHIADASDKFMEKLPPSCPPPEAKEVAIPSAYRIIGSAKPTIDDFKSHAAKGYKPRPDVTDCIFAACSLFVSRAKAASVAKLPKLRLGNPHLCHVKIEISDGRSLIGKSDHVSFWMYKTFNVAKAIKSIEPI